MNHSESRGQEGSRRTIAPALVVLGACLVAVAIVSGRFWVGGDSGSKHSIGLWSMEVCSPKCLSGGLSSMASLDATWARLSIAALVVSAMLVIVALASAAKNTRWLGRGAAFLCLFAISLTTSAMYRAPFADGLAAGWSAWSYFIGCALVLMGVARTVFDEPSATSSTS